MKILYFSWLRERIGVSSEILETNSKNIKELVDELRNLDPRYAQVFNDLSQVKVAVDQELINDFRHSIVGATEVAFFPPMTGG